MLFKQRNAIRNFLICNFSCMTQNDATCIFNLIIKELAEVFHVHFALIGINYGRKSVKDRTLGICILNSFYNVRELAHA